MVVCDICGYEPKNEHGLKVHRSMKHLDSEEERFMDKVEKKDGCWIWQGSKSKRGYGNFITDRQMFTAHRYMMSEVKVKDVEGKYVNHKCDNKICVNPDHLYVGTPTENQMDAVNRGRKSTGEDCSWSKLTAIEVIAIHELGNRTNTRHIDLANEYGVGKRTVGRAINEKSWKELWS